MSVSDELTSRAAAAAAAAAAVTTNGNFNTFGDFKRNSNAYASLPNRASGLWTDEDADMANTLTRSQKAGLVARDNSLESDTAGHSFGLSNSLSSDSIKQACDYYDDELSDDDFIEVQSTPQSFNQNRASKSRKAKNANGYRNPQKKAIDEHPLWTVDMGEQKLGDRSELLLSGAATPDEAFHVLNELDAILDKHGAAQLNVLGQGDDSVVEDYLMDLDNYLEEMDNDNESGVSPRLTPTAATQQSVGKELERNLLTRTLPISGNKRKQVKSDWDVKTFQSTDDLGFKRGEDCRRTIAGTLPGISQELSQEVVPGDWRRNSVRLAVPLFDENEEPTKAVECVVSHSNSMTSDLCPMSAINNERSLRDDAAVNLHEPVASASIAEREIRRCISQGNFATGARASHCNEMLTDAHIFDSLLQQETQQNNDNRPRQFGRRVEGHPLGTPSNASILSHHDGRRPMSAPAQTAHYAQRESLDGSLSDASSVRCSRIPSPVSVASSIDSSSTATSTNERLETNLSFNENNQTTANAPLDPDGTRLREKCGFNSAWPHSCSRTLTLFGCTLGLFNICRFAVLTINYGGNFLLQFLLLSFIFGIPLFWLQMCLGNKIKAGPVSMWKISPICSGIGIALVMIQCFLAIYSTVTVAWILVYLRDTFPAKGKTLYRWQELAFPYRFLSNNTNANLTDTVADYFNIVVLQRLQFAKRSDSTGVRFHVNDRLAFYLALIWAAVFLILCKGLKSLGNMAYIIFSLPLLALIVITVKFVYIVDPTKLQNIFSANDLDEFLINAKTWTAATQETFLTWGLLGASVIAISSRTNVVSNTYSLRRDAIIIVLVTFFGLSVTALLALCCAQILKQNGYVYVPGSFENPESYTAVYSLKAQINTELISYPHNFVPHYSSFIGETYRRPNSLLHRESGYQALRFLTEIFPAVLSLSRDSLTWVWTAVAYSMFAGFGLAQLCVMWKPISSALGNSTSSVLLSCVTGLLLSIPFATEMGISILYYMDFLLGGSWFIPLLWMAQIFGVFLIRGRPYNGDDLVNDLRMSASMSAFLALSWNVLLPIGLITLSIVDYKTSLSNQFYYWRGKSYFSYWTRKVGSLIQIGLLLIVPITAIIQIYRYLTNGPPDILERIQLLYRPAAEANETRRACGRNRDITRRNLDANGGSSSNNEANRQQMQNDAPPKYTPPPSYTTATGARLAKIFRQSIRRSVRRVLGGDANSRARPTLQIDAESNQQSSPPDYLTILTNASGNVASTQQCSSESIEIGQRPSANGHNNQRSLTLGRKVLLQRQQQRDATVQRPSSARAHTELVVSNGQRPYTAEDVVTILRSSVRNRPARQSTANAAGSVASSSDTVPHIDNSFRSIENLVLNAEPPDQTPGVGGALEDSAERNNTSVI